MEMAHRPEAHELAVAWAEIELLYRTAPVGLCLLDPDLRFVRINKLLADINGVAMDDHLGRSIRDVLPDLADTIEPLYRSVIKTRRPELDREITGKTLANPDRTGHWRVSYVPLEKENGELLGVSTVVYDITDLREAQERIADERDLARKYLDVSGVTIVGLDRDGVVNLINRAGCDLLGLPKERVLGRDWFDSFVPESICDGVRKAFGQIIQGSIKANEQYQNPVVTASGDIRTMSWFNTVLRGPEGEITGTLSSGTDITDRLREEEYRRELLLRLQRAEKLHVIGGIAAGIAHDFNSLLMVIGSNLDLLKTSLSKPDAASGTFRVQEALDGIDEAAQTGKQLVERVLAWGRSSRRRGQQTDPHRVIRDFAGTLRGLVGEGVEFVMNLAPDNGTVDVDEEQLKQVLMNTVRNAREAVEGAGAIRLSTSVTPLPAASIQDQADIGANPVFELCVTDNGAGVRPEHLGDVCKPFFSTKEGSRGSGLGLSIVQNIVEQAGGRVEVESEPRHGCTVKCFFSFHPPQDQKPG